MCQQDDNEYQISEINGMNVRCQSQPIILNIRDQGDEPLLINVLLTEVITWSLIIINIMALILMELYLSITVHMRLR